MKNHIVRTTQITKDGLSKTSTDDKPNIDDRSDTLNSFEVKCLTAKNNGQEWVETTPEIIALMQPRGLGGSKFFCYKGVKVCEFGKSEEIQAECDIPMGKKLHGEGEAIVLSGA